MWPWESSGYGPDLVAAVSWYDTPTGDFELNGFNVHHPPQHGESSVASRLEPVTRRPQVRNHNPGHELGYPGLYAFLKVFFKKESIGKIDKCELIL
ncbi:hypothetical protein TNCV_1404011 [Trichonephila clavipes]|nr:hypothetical protein TNCV_1404011 [Trichonephila clavipes]